MGEEYQADIPVWEGDGMEVDMTQGLGLGEQGQGLAYELIHTADDADDDGEQQQQQQQQQQVCAISRGDIIVLPGPSGQWELCCVIRTAGAAATASSPSTTGTGNGSTGANGCYRNSYTDGGTGTDIDSDMEDSHDGDYDDSGMLSSSSSSSSSSSRMLLGTGTTYSDRERGGKGGGKGKAIGEGEGMMQGEEEGEENDEKLVRIFDGVQERVVSMSATPTRPGQLLSFADLQLFLGLTGQGG